MKSDHLIEIEVYEFEQEMEIEAKNFELKGFRQGKVPKEIIYVHKTKSIIDKLFGRKIYEVVIEVANSNNMNERILEILFGSEISNYTFDHKQSKWLATLTINIPDIKKEEIKESEPNK